MLTLYVKDGCPFSAQVLSVLDELELACERKNIADDGVRGELLEVGGKLQVPFLYDQEKKKGIYEARDISTYLIQEYTAKHI